MPRKPKLTELQEKFSCEYLVDFDEIAATQRAGYKYKSEADLKRKASNLLTNANVQQRIADLQLDRTNLNQRQKLACRYFLEGGCTQTEAYRKAGYEGDINGLRVSASRLFARPDVKQYLRDLGDRLALEAEVDHAWVMKHAKAWVEAGTVAITDVSDILPDGTIRVKDIHQLPRHMQMAVQEIQRTEIPIGEGGFKVETKIKLHRRDTTSLALIARHIGFGSDWNAMLRTAEKYGYEVRQTATGYELVSTLDEAIDVEAQDMNQLEGGQS